MLPPAATCRDLGHLPPSDRAPTRRRRRTGRRANSEPGAYVIHPVGNLGAWRTDRRRVRPVPASAVPPTSWSAPDTDEPARFERRAGSRGRVDGTIRAVRRGGIVVRYDDVQGVLCASTGRLGGHGWKGPGSAVDRSDGSLMLVDEGRFNEKSRRSTVHLSAQVGPATSRSSTVSSMSTRGRSEGGSLTSAVVAPVGRRSSAWVPACPPVQPAARDRDRDRQPRIRSHDPDRRATDGPRGP